MDPADNVQSQLSSLVQLTTSHHQQIQELASAIRELALQRNPAPVAQASVSENTTAHAAVSAAPAPVPPTAPRCGVHLPTPERFAGQPGECHPFLLSCEITFQLQASSFPDELTKVAYVISLLSGKAKRWATAEWERRSSVCASYRAFSEELRKIFDSATPRQDAARSLFQTIQDGRSVAEYATDFPTAAAEIHRVTHRTKPLLVSIAEQHREWLSFLIIPSPRAPAMFGFPWLQRHNPRLDWTSGRVLEWGISCHASCLSSVPQTPSRSGGESTSDLGSVPAEYHDLGVVFSKARALSLPPHRPYDCGIDLLPGTAPPRGRLYHLTGPEREAMADYIRESLASGIIRPSSSPAGAGFFFVKKKD
ncbi:hypothetical protein C0J45_11303, partial [Silurus meridionalis]